MSNYINTSPWMLGANDLGETFSRLMLNMAQLRAQQGLASQQAGLRQQEIDLDQSRLGAQTPLWEAQAARDKAAAGYDQARTNEMKQTGENAQDTGLAFFARALAPVGYNPLTGSELDISKPEVLDALTRALTARRLGESVAMSPTASASLLRGQELNKDTSFYDMVLGKNVAQGPVSPRSPFTLGPGYQAYMPGEGTPFATNTNLPAGGDTDLDTAQAARIIIDLLSQQQKDSMGYGTGKNLADLLPQGRQTLTNAAQLLSIALQRALGGQSKTNNPSATTGRVRVQGPNGETGTMDAGDALPSGWRIIQ